MDAVAFSRFITPDGTFRWGSNPTMTGTQQITDFVNGFYSMIKSLQHTVHRTWTADTDGKILFVEGDVSYTLPNGKVVPVPFFNKFVMKGDLIHEYRVYADPTPMFKAME